jgi:hypothetical protein
MGLRLVQLLVDQAQRGEGPFAGVIPRTNQTMTLPPLDISNQLADIKTAAERMHNNPFSNELPQPQQQQPQAAGISALAAPAPLVQQPTAQQQQNPLVRANTLVRSLPDQLGEIAAPASRRRGTYKEIV